MPDTQVLTREQLKKITGGQNGSGGSGGCSCSCSGMPGTWHYTGGAQPSKDYLEQDINTYCNGSGACSGCTNW